MTYWVIIQFDRIAWRDALPSCVIRIQDAYLEVNLEGFFCILDRSAYGSGVEIGFLGVIFFFLCGLQINNESGLNAEARSKQKTMGLFSTSIQLPRGCNSYFVNQRGWTAVVWLFLTNGKREKKKHQKTASYAGFRAPSSHVGSLRLVFIMRAREGQSILWYYQKLRLVWPKML